jgi:hypothetical protein
MSTGCNVKKENENLLKWQIGPQGEIYKLQGPVIEYLYCTKLHRFIEVIFIVSLIIGA